MQVTRVCCSLAAAPRVTFESDSHSNGIGIDLEVGVVNSPPVSTESVSSGHHSPPVTNDNNPRPFISKSIIQVGLLVSPACSYDV